MAEPWDEDVLQTHADAFIFPSGHLDYPAGSVQLSEVESQGRYRFSDDPGPGPAVGYSLNVLSLRGRQTLLPSQLADVSLGGALPLGSIRDWSIGVSGAVGYAGDRPFATSTAWYGRADIVASHEIKPGTRFLLLLEYDGNRGILPDVPLPGIAYSSKVNEQLEYTLGYPTTSITWRPFKGIGLEANWYVPDSAGASIEYSLGEHWSIFLAFDAQDSLYHSSNLHGNRRIFFLEDRLEAGARWKLNDSINFVVAGGYAFARQFVRGFDEIDTNRISRLSDQPYLRLGFSASF